MTQKSRRKGGVRSFNPGSEFIHSAVLQYLQTGGEITKFKEIDEDREPFIPGGDYLPAYERLLPS